MKGFRERDRLFWTDIDRTSIQQVHNGDRESQDSRGKDHKEHSDLANDANDDRDEMADILVDTEFEQLVNTK